MKRLVTPILAIAAAAAFLFAQSSIALAQSAEEKSYLAMYFTEAELTVVSATRSLKSISQVAENVHVVTATDIELMNAHTLAEVLNTVTGVQVFFPGHHGAKAQASIQGVDETHTTVLIDGIVLNYLGSNVAEIGRIPVQNIEKIEIIKGPASSSWGSALGGVVNIITKQGSLGNAGGMLSGSYGERNTGDFRAEARGKQDRFGYYLTAGRLQTDGLTSNFRVSENNAYTKFTYDITDNTGILFTLGYMKTSRGDGVFSDFDFFADQSDEAVQSTLGLNSALGNHAELIVALRSIRQRASSRTFEMPSGALLEDEKSTDKGYGASAKITWKTSFHSIVLGSEFDDKTLDASSMANGEKTLRDWAIFVNDTIALNNIAIIPGFRYDYTSTNGDITSPSLGLTYSLHDDTIFRVYAARGFQIPTLFQTFGDSILFAHNSDLKMETVWSYQAGAETAALKYIWLKVSAFRHDVRDAFFAQNLSEDPPLFTIVNQGRHRRQGLEFEVKTLPVFNTSLFGGAELISAKDLETGETIKDVPTHVYDLGLRYDDEQSLRALLKGRYINWNSSPSDIPALQGSYGSFVFDLNVIKKIYQRRDASLEAYAAAYNIFNGDQYLFSVYKNPERRFEGGLRYSF